MIKFRTEPTDKQTILEDGFALYKQTLKIALPYSVIIACLVTLPSLFVLTPLWMHTPFYIISGLCAFLTFGLSCALLFRLYCFGNAVPCSVNIALKQTLVHLPTLLYILVLYCIIVLSGTMLLIIPGVILAFSLQFSFIIALTDNESVLQSLISSHRLVADHWWHTFSIMITLFLFALIMNLISLLCILAILSLLSLTLASAILIIFPVSIIIQSLMLPLILNTSLVLLNDLKRRQASRRPPWH